MPRHRSFPADRFPTARFAAAGLTAVLATGGLAACSTDEAEVVPRTQAGATTAAPADDPVEATVAASTLAFESADVVVLGPAESAEAVAGMAGELGVPGLLGSASELADELERLGAETVLVPAGTGSDTGGEGADGDDSGADGEAGDSGLETLEFDPEDLSVDGSEPQIAEPDAEAAATLLLDPAEAEAPGSVVARASVEAAAGAVAEVPTADPRATSDSVAAAQASDGDGVLALGAAFGDAEVVERRMATARTAPELPGGGQLAFPGRRMIAAYGSPGVPSMGILGEQDLDATVQRVQDLAAEYDDHSDVPALPAMEIITTIASSQPGADGDYSAEVDPETLRPWIDRAAEEGIYVVLDLQPGTTHFLEQAKLYEDLLKEPHVGLALDPEWRLEDGQKHLEQIGSVDAAEVNEVATWLADLTQENNLPQKVFILHQFSGSMIADREDVDASREELAMVLHADGNGTPGMKMGTYDSLRADLPEGIRMAWKNFYDEDDPTFTPEQTMDVEPTPWFVSYQ
ncbi:MAG: hypothetical protein ACTHYJ_07765 [Brevibacterium yomogidense]|uniref:hypothetical protein n=1 Tax=Brevibacterium sp. Mu109 TaxID=1255669 RepID=UPI000C3A2E96|nr:hypothetical protein [Brevibacterium sp. Mu109]SMX65298.1 hypothetical protein BSP109_00186 [Brevibacterium sp. Mu109]